MTGKIEERMCIICRIKFLVELTKVGQQHFRKGNNPAIYTSDFGVGFVINKYTHWFCNKCWKEIRK